MVASATVLVVILRQFGAGRAMIGSITSIETCSVLFPQMLGLYLFRTRARRKVELIAYHYVAIIPFLFLIAWLLQQSPHLSAATVRIGILACWAGFVISCGILMAVWMDWVAGLFEVRFRGTVMGLAFCASSILGTAGGLLSGWSISHGHAAHTYALLYFWSAWIASLSIFLFWFIEDPCRLDCDMAPPSPNSILGIFRESLSDGDFRAFLIGRILTTSGFCILPLIGDYFSSAEGGAVAPGALVSSGASIALGMAVANLGLGRIGDKFGHRLGLIIGIATQILALVLLLFAPGRMVCLPVYFAAGICGGSAFLSHYNMVFETCPHDNRSAHIALANLVIGGCTAFTPILAGLAAAYLGMHLVFAVSLALSVLALAWFLLRVREPRQTAAG